MGACARRRGGEGTADRLSACVRALVARTKAFKQDGISAYALTGATLEHASTSSGDRLPRHAQLFGELARYKDNG
jgi:hypothetical protein